MAYPYEEEDRRAALTQGLLAAGLAALGARKGSEYNALGQAGLLGIGGYQNALKNSTDAREAQAMLQMRKQQFDQQQAMWAEQQRQQQARQAAAGAAFVGGRPAMPGGEAEPREGGMTPGLPGQAGTFSPQAYIAALQQQGLPEQAIAAQEKYAKPTRELKDTRTLMQNGQRVTVNFYKDGTHEVVPFAPDAEKPHFVSTGGKVGVPLDPFTGKPLGEGVQATVDPNTQYTGNITMRGQNMTDARSRESNATSLVGKQADATSALRKEFQGLDEVKNFKAAVPMVESARRAPDTPAGDLDLIYAVGKALDPNSVVREGELNLVIKSGTPVEQFQGYARMIAQGKGRLPPAQRQKLIAMLENRVGQLEQSYSRTRSAYERQAAAMGLPAEQIFADVAPRTGASGGWSAVEIK
jgi:hypothetical protein